MSALQFISEANGLRDTLPGSTGLGGSAPPFIEFSPLSSQP